MNYSFPVLISLSLLAATATAQTPASAKVLVPCTQPASVGSMLARPTLPLTYADDDNKVVIEMEAKEAIGNWVEESIVSGFAGDSYFRWNGPDLFNTPGVDILTYRFAVSSPGTYLIRLHVRSDDPDPSEENDCWARLNGGWASIGRFRC